MVKTGKDAGNIFEFKQRELVAAKTGANVVTENRALAQEFEKEVTSLETRSEAVAAKAVRESEAEIRQGRIILISAHLDALDHFTDTLSKSDTRAWLTQQAKRSRDSLTNAVLDLSL